MFIQRSPNTRPYRTVTSNLPDSFVTFYERIWNCALRLSRRTDHPIPLPLLFSSTIPACFHVHHVHNSTCWHLEFGITNRCSPITTIPKVGCAHLSRMGRRSQIQL